VPDESLFYIALYRVVLCPREREGNSKNHTARWGSWTCSRSRSPRTWSGRGSPSFARRCAASTAKSEVMREPLLSLHAPPFHNVCYTSYLDSSGVLSVHSTDPACTYATPTYIASAV
jgi:hypothetical protein